MDDTSVVIHGTIFNNSYTGGRFGGAGVICKKITNENSDFDTEQMNQLDVQYCCFQDCYGTGKNEGDDLTKLYGVALFMAAKNTVLYYASTVDCPGFKEGREEAAGAQFDMNSNNVTSKYVNSTGGHSEFCGGIEYRKTTKGFFRFQTISKTTCMFAISYTDIEKSTADLDLSFSNIIDITLFQETPKGKLYPGLIHVRNTEEYADYTFQISNFCFLNNKIEGNSRIISRGVNGESLQPIKIIMNNCTYDCDDNLIAITEDFSSDYLVTSNCNAGELRTANEIKQLLLGNCKGAVTPEPFTPLPFTSNFSESVAFSNSDKFSESDSFTPSPSDKFTSSDKFSKSNGFTYSQAFTRSNEPQFPPPPNPPGDAKSNDKNKSGMIAGISVAAVAVVAAIIIAAIYLMKKKRLNVSDADIETIDENNNSVNNVNPIYDNNAEDDPFKEDFTS